MKFPVLISIIIYDDCARNAVTSFYLKSSFYVTY